MNLILIVSLDIFDFHHISTAATRNLGGLKILERRSLRPSGHSQEIKPEFDRCSRDIDDPSTLLRHSVDLGSLMALSVKYQYDPQPSVPDCVPLKQ